MRTSLLDKQAAQARRDAVRKDALTLATLLRVAECNAKQWARRVFWVDVDELIAVALATGWAAVGTFDPKVGVTLASYLERAINCRLSDAVRRDSSPVSASSMRTGELIGLRRAPLQPAMRDGTLLADEQLSRAEWRRAVRVHFEVISAVPAATLGVHALCRKVLLNDPTPAHSIAEMAGVSIKTVYKSTGVAMRLLRTNVALGRIAKEV